MLIQKMRCYFLYNVPVTETLFSLDGDHPIGVSVELIDLLEDHFRLEKAFVPAFFTNHYRTEHTPYLVTDALVPQQTSVSREALASIDFFRGLGLNKDLTLGWEFMLTLQNTGLITLCLEVEDTMQSESAYHLGGLHLNPKYAVIATGPIKQLWSHRPEHRPKHVTLDALAQIIREHFLINCGLEARRVQALRHEIQIPFTSIEVETDYQDQETFIQRWAKEISEFVFKPACWEVERPSLSHAERILTEDRVWSVAQDTYVVLAYEGALYLKINTFNTGVEAEVSGFRLADEDCVLHTFKMGVSNYQFLHILDDLIDREMPDLQRNVNKYQSTLRAAFKDPHAADATILSDMNDFIIQVDNLQYKLVNTLEEMDNSDKLIDEEWHIVLLDKLNDAFGTKLWRDNILKRVDLVRGLAENVEDAYQRFIRLTDTKNAASLNEQNVEVNKRVAKMNEQLLRTHEEEQKMEGYLRVLGYVVSVLAMAELIGLVINLGLDDENALIQSMSYWLSLDTGSSHVIATSGVLLLIAVIFVLLLALERRVNRN